MSGLTKVRKLIRRPVRRSRIVRLTKKVFGENTLETQRIIKALNISTALYRGKKRRNGEARISHERDMFIIYMVYLSGKDPDLALAILLHDLHEDYRKLWPLYRIEKEFGKEARRIVSAATKPRMSLTEQVSARGNLRIANRVKKGGKKVMLLKCIDRLHFFLKPFPTTDKRKLVWKVVQTMQLTQQMALDIRELMVELELAVAYCIVRSNITNEEISEFV